MATIGQTLSAARVAAGYTVADLSIRTRIREPVLTAIEQEDFFSCGGDFYARGHIRRVCRTLGLDPAPLLAEYDREHASRAIPAFVPPQRHPASVPEAARAAAAARAVSEPGAPYDAAICAVIAGERYGLHALASGIGDRSDAATRFIYLSRPDVLPAPTGADLTSLVAFIADDHPGVLIEVLNQFAVRGVNLTRLESRPTGDRLGSYCFCIDAEGHVAEARVGKALMGIRRVCRDVRFLGSYPRSGRATENDPLLRPRPATDADFAEAEQWLTRIRAGQVD